MRWHIHFWGKDFPFQIFKEFLKVQALKDQQVEAGKSKTAFALHQKRDDHFMKEAMKIISFWNKLSALINSMISIVGNISEKLDQVYCAWLIKWVVKREIIQLAELCLTRWWIISGTWWYWVSIWRYWLVLGQYKLVLLGIRWYMVSKGLVCLYILEKVEIWSGVTDAWHTDSLTDNRI